MIVLREAANQTSRRTSLQGIDLISLNRGEITPTGKYGGLCLTLIKLAFVHAYKHV